MLVIAAGCQPGSSSDTSKSLQPETQPDMRIAAAAFAPFYGAAPGGALVAGDIRQLSQIDLQAGLGTEVLPFLDARALVGSTATATPTTSIVPATTAPLPNGASANTETAAPTTVPVASAPTKPGVTTTLAPPVTVAVPSTAAPRTTAPPTTLAPAPTTATPPTTAAPAPTTVSPPPTTLAPAPEVALSGSAAAEIFDRANGARAAAGLPGLRRDGSLDEAAAGWAVELARSGVLRHSSLPNQIVGRPWRTVGENVGYGPTAVVVHEALMRSPGHQANILGSGFSAVGVGAAIDVRGRVWVVQLFAG